MIKSWRDRIGNGVPSWVGWLSFGILNRWGIVGVLVCLAIGGLVLRFPPRSTLENGQWDWWALCDVVVTFATFLVALAVWFGETWQDWNSQLPKRLNVRFEYKGHTLLYCRGAYLSGESDIRQWGQQIGGQMAGTQFLKFLPFIIQLGPTRERVGSQWVRTYEVVFQLAEIPKGRKPDEEVPSDENGLLLMKDLATQAKARLWEAGLRDGVKKSDVDCSGIDRKVRG